MGVDVYFYSFFNLGATWGWVVNTTPRSLYPRKRDPVPFVQEVQGRSGRVWKIWPSPGFDPRIVQPVASYPGSQIKTGLDESFLFLVNEFSSCCNRICSLSVYLYISYDSHGSRYLFLQVALPGSCSKC